MQKKVLFSLRLFCVLATVITVAHTKCIHDEVVPQVTKGISPQVYDDAKSDWQSRNSKRSFAAGFSPLRITFDVSFLTVGSDAGFTCYDSSSTITIFSGLSGSSYSCLPQDVLSQAKFNFINSTLLVQTKDALSNTFGVRPVTVSLLSYVKLTNRETSFCETTPVLTAISQNQKSLFLTLINKETLD